MRIPQGRDTGGLIDDATTAQRVQSRSDAEGGSDPDFDQLLGLGGEASVHLFARGEERLVRRSSLDPEAAWGEVPEAWDHPHLVWIKDVERRRRSLLLEHLPGGSAAGLIAARGRLPLGETVTLLVPVARALAHLHSFGASHGDVHPGNVLFRADGAPVLVDPGLARALGEAPRPGGTPGFDAPEAEHNAAADVYGWGALAWFVMTGEAPGEGGYRVPLSLHCQGVAAGTAELIEDCLDADPLMRPAAADLAPELLAAQEAAPLDATAAAQSEGAAHLITRGAASRHSPHRPSAGALGRLTPKGWVIRRGRRREAALALSERFRGRGHSGSAPGGHAVDGAASGRRGPVLRRRWGGGQRVTDFVRRDSRNASRRASHRGGATWRLVVGIVAAVLGVGTLWLALDRPGWQAAERAMGQVGTAPTWTAPPAVPRSTGVPFTPSTATAPSASASGTRSNSAPSPPANAAPAPTTSRRAAQVASALSALDRARTAAIKNGDVVGLHRIYSSARARAADEALLRELQRRGVKYQRLESRVEKARVLSDSGGARPTVIVQAVATSVAVERGNGGPASSSRAQSTLRFTLVLTGQGWRIKGIERL